MQIKSCKLYMNLQTIGTYLYHPQASIWYWWTSRDENRSFGPKNYPNWEDWDIAPYLYQESH